jgi:hypothetical protein
MNIQLLKQIVFNSKIARKISEYKHILLVGFKGYKGNQFQEKPILLIYSKKQLTD